MIQRLSADMWCLRNRPVTGNVLVRRLFWRPNRVGKHAMQRIQRYLPAVLRLQHSPDRAKRRTVRA